MYKLLLYSTLYWQNPSNNQPGHKKYSLAIRAVSDFAGFLRLSFPAWMGLAG